MKFTTVILAAFLFTCLTGWTAEEGANAENLSKQISSDLEKISVDCRWFGWGECRIFVKAGTKILNQGPMLRVYPESMRWEKLRETVTGDEGFNDELKKLSSETTEKWFPMHGGHEVTFKADMVVTVIARKGGLINVVSKAGGYPLVALEPSNRQHK